MAHADVIDGDRIVVQTHWLEKDQIRLIPGVRWDANLRVWYLPLSWAAGVQLRGVFGAKLTYGDGLLRWAREERARRIEPSLKLRELTSYYEQFSDTRLYEFQRAGVAWLLTAGSCLLGDEMGTGKTVQILAAMERAVKSLPAVVVCPNSVKHTWAREVDKWLPLAMPYVVEGSAAQRAKILKAAADDPTALVIINIEAVRSHSRLAPFGSTRLAACPDCGGHDPRTTPARCEVHPRELNTIPFKTVIVDEAHRIKDPNAKQTRACWAVGQGKTVTTRYALTGTPIANDPSDLWSVMHFVEPKEYPRKSAFVDRYCLLSWGTYGGIDVKGIHPEHRQEFYSIFDPRFRRMPKALVLPQLPPKIYTTRHVDLTPKQSKAYRDIADTLVTRLPDGSLMVARDDLVAQTRLLQFSSATMQSTPDGFRMCDPSPKVDALIEIWEERGGRPFAACAEHRQLIDLAALRFDKLKIPYGRITGGQQPWERDQTLRDFQDGKLDVLLFTLKAGGTGLTMTAADLIVFLQRSWSMIDNRQAEDRVHRIGSEVHESIQVVHLIAQGTVEDVQVERLIEKSLRLDEITRDRARLAAAGIDAEVGLGVSMAELDLEAEKILTSNLGDPL